MRACRAHRGATLASVLTFVLLLVAAPAASAACGPHLHRPAGRDAVGGRAPLVIGDSVVAGAVPQVAAKGFEVDAQCGRQRATGMSMIRARKRAGTLPRMVVWALGTNGPQTQGDIGRLRRLVGVGRRVVVVTPRGPVPWVPGTVRAYRAAAATWESVVLADWASYSSGKGGWLAPDGIHLQASGAAGMARLLAGTLRHYPRPAPAPKPPPAFQPIPAPPAPRPATTRRVRAPAALSTPTAVDAVDAPTRAVPATTRAGDVCGGVRTLRPSKRRNTGRAPLVIGDSVLLGGMPQAASAGYAVDAHGCRQIDEGVAVIRRARRAGRLPRLVVLQLGTNGTIRTADISRVLRLMGPRRTLGLITSRSAGGADNDSATAMRAAARRWPDRVALVDWQRTTRRRGGWFQPDGIHLTPDGARGLAAALRSLLPFASPPRAPEPPAWQPVPARAAPTSIRPTQQEPTP